MKRSLFHSVLAVIPTVFLMIAACSWPAWAAAPAQPMELKFVSFLPNQWPNNAGFAMFADKVKQKSNGALIIKIVGGPEAMAPNDAPKAVQSGSVPIADVLNSLADQIVPGFRVLSHNELPYPEMRARALPYIQEICNKAGIYYLGQAKTAAPQTMLANCTIRKITKLDDFKGVKMGTSSPRGVPFFRALGAVPQVIPQNEYYVAMERGVVEGVTYGTEDIVSSGLHRIIKTAVDHPFSSSPDSFIINLQVWKSLPKNFQDVLTEAAIETENEFNAMYDAKIREPAREEMKKAGVQFVKFSPAEAAKYHELYKTSSWTEEAKKNPEVVNKLKELITKN